MGGGVRGGGALRLAEVKQEKQEFKKEKVKVIFFMTFRLSHM